MTGLTEIVDEQGKRKEFKELISPHMAPQLIYTGVLEQYMKTPEEDEFIPEIERRRHFEAEVLHGPTGKRLHGVERLYKSTILLEPSTKCVSHCRFCLRGQYDTQTLSDSQITDGIEYIASQPEASEVLITGGDPLLTPSKTSTIIDRISDKCPKIRVVRIGSRLPIQVPELIMEKKRRKIYDYLFKRRDSLSVEVGTQINHPNEITPDSMDCYDYIRSKGVRVYDQSVFLRGVNDDLDTLVELYTQLRNMGIEPHYLFHAIPMKGTHHFRTSIDRMVNVFSRLTSSGLFSGRGKPRMALLTDVGKVELYPQSIVALRETSFVTNKGRKVLVPELLIKTGYNAEERMRYNPDFKQSSETEVDKEGNYRVWYMDSWK